MPHASTATGDALVLVCGEALLDIFCEGDASGGLALDARVGGSPFNVALGLARLGQPVAIFTAVSRDMLGARLMRALDAEGVDTAMVVRSDAPSTLALVGLDEQGAPSYAFYGEGGADRQIGLDTLAALPSGWAAIHLGSFATVVAPIAATLRALVEREHGHALIAYDPNVRLNVEPALAPWRDMLAWMLPRCDLLKISAEDLQLLRPGSTAVAFAQDALAAGVKLVVVTRGGEGALGWTAGQHVAIDPVPVCVVDTVGAGDSFQAALLARLAEGGRLSAAGLASLDAAALRDLLGCAARAAAITCSRRGADLPRRAELG